MTDFVAVKRRDRQLGDAQFFQHELNDDFGIEMEIVRVLLERNLRQRRGRIEAIAGVKFRELRPQRPVLECGENLVADPFVERHAAARAARLSIMREPKTASASSRTSGRADREIFPARIGRRRGATRRCRTLIDRVAVT